MLLVLNVSGFFKTSMVVSNTAKPSVHECICICTQSWSKQRFLGLGTFLGCSGKRWIESIESKFLQNQNIQPIKIKEIHFSINSSLTVTVFPFYFLHQKAAENPDPQNLLQLGILVLQTGHFHTELLHPGVPRDLFVGWISWETMNNLKVPSGND